MAERKKSLKQQEMEAQLELLKAQVAAMNAATAQAQAAAQQAAQPVIVRGEAMVGIRNISSYTIGFTHPKFGEIQLYPSFDGNMASQSWAIVPEAWWTTELRQSIQMKQGMIMRDDSVLSSGTSRAPEDRPEDLPASWAKNAVINPYQWIESKSDRELREAIEAMDSAPTLRRLAAAVDRKIFAIGEEHYKDDDERAAKAIRDLPMHYRLVDDETARRLDELNPMRAERKNESKNTIRF